MMNTTISRLAALVIAYADDHNISVANSNGWTLLTMADEALSLNMAADTFVEVLTLVDYEALERADMDSADGDIVV